LSASANTSTVHAALDWEEISRWGVDGW
jgi:hypothetical protein